MRSSSSWSSECRQQGGGLGLGGSRRQQAQRQACRGVCAHSIEGGELFERIVDEDYQLTEVDTMVFVRQICDGILFMHKMRVLHLDLKVLGVGGLLGGVGVASDHLRSLLQPTIPPSPMTPSPPPSSPSSCKSQNRGHIREQERLGPSPLLVWSCCSIC